MEAPLTATCTGTSISTLRPQVFSGLSSPRMKAFSVSIPIELTTRTHLSCRQISRQRFSPP